MFTFVRHSRQVLRYRVSAPTLVNTGRGFLTPHCEHFLAPESTIGEYYPTAVDKVMIDCLTRVWHSKDSAVAK